MVFLDFAFDGAVLTDTIEDCESEIYKQLQYTVGQLNGDDSVGRIGEVELSNIAIEQDTLISNGGDGYRVSYHARFPVAWGKPDAVPEVYTFKLPVEITWLGNMFFVGEHSEKCVWEFDQGLTPDTFFWHYRPEAEGCELVPELTREIEAVVTPGESKTAGMYPEIHKIWEDDALRVVVVFAAYSKGRLEGERAEGVTDDSGIRSYNDFNVAMHDRFAGYDMTTDPLDALGWPDVTEVHFEWRDDGGSIFVDSFLVDSLETAGEDFLARYNEVSARADVIIYNGHSGYGGIVQRFERMGDWSPGQYVVIAFNSCDSYAYGDGGVAAGHAAVNSDDPTGTRHVDTIYNVMASHTDAGDETSMIMIQGLMDPASPKRFDQICEEIHKYIDGNEDVSIQQLPVVTGEQDNVFFPGSDLFTWFRSGSIASSEENPIEIGHLAAGEYEFYLSATGDSDMRVVAGSATVPCVPTTDGSGVSCHLTLDGSTDVSVVIRASEAIDYELRGSGCRNNCTPHGNVFAGDANLDGVFDAMDIVAVLQAGRYLTGAPATWAEGDWNGDGVFDQWDLVLALQEADYLT
jgi:hypothetical protein